MKIIKCKIRNTNNYKDIMVDDEDFEFLSKFKWSEHSYKYAVTWIFDNEKNKKVVKTMHSILIKGEKGKHIDHIDGNVCNNQKSNLRLCSVRENILNSKMKRNNSSGYIGVSWSSHAKKWRSYVSIEGKRKHLGYFDSSKDAAKKYNEMAILHYGEFARLNDI